MRSLPDDANPARGHRRPALHPQDWRSPTSGYVDSLADLCAMLRLPPQMVDQASGAAAEFPLRVARPFAARMRPGDPMDPLLLQVLPRPEECRRTPGFSADPVCELASDQPDVLHKYPGRLLVVTPGPCAIHCRYCFRRHYAHGRSTDSSDLWRRTLIAAASDSSIAEVILSGGDPLGLDDAELAGLANRLAAIPHVRRIRIHTRFPIAVPSRVNHDLLTWLVPGRFVPIVVAQINHPAEIDVEVAAALGRLVATGILVFNQSVLLAGVNDHIDILDELCNRLIELRVVPYYLHQLDRVAGAAHFEVPESLGRDLMRRLRNRLSGYAVPRYVRETTGPAFANKEPLI